MRSELLAKMYNLKAELVDECTLCGGVGIDSSLRECKCRVVQHYLNSLIEAKIPVKFWDLTFEDLSKVRPEEALRLVEHYMTSLKAAISRSLGLLFIGANSRGKTALQCIVGKEAIAQGYCVQYFTAQQYVDAAKAKGDKSKLLEEYESGQLILLDELDKVYIAKASDFVPKTLEDFVRRMISKGASLVICTNLLEEELVEMFGETTMSILQGHLKFVLLSTLIDNRLEQKKAWLARLNADVSYYHPSIVEKAYRLRALEEAL